MQMKAALSKLESLRLGRFDAPKESAIERVASAMKLPPIVIEAKAPPDIDAISERIRRAFRQGSIPDSADLRHAPWCIWGGLQPLEHDPDVIDSYLQFLKRSGKKSSFRRLAAAYIVKFPTASAVLHRVAGLLREMAPQFTGPWTNASKALGVFDPDEAPRRIASIALEVRKSPAEVFVDHGLNGLAAGAGLAEAAFLEGLRQIREFRMGPLDRLAAITRWTGAQDQKRGFNIHRGPIADALVLPHETPMPEKAERDRLLTFLLANFNDPRLSANTWAPMRCRPVVTRWLIEQSLRQFLDIVDRIARADHWVYRRAFWSAVYGKGLISDACVIFDEVGAYHAGRVFETETPYSEWNSLGRKTIENGHSCLLLRVGHGLVAEWSHMGRCNIWRDANDPTAPKLHKGVYSSSEVMVGRQHPDWQRDAFTHSSPRTYSWQDKVADEIYAMTGTRLMRSEYEVVN